MMTIDFTPDGNARCLHSEEIPLQSIGTLSVSRASNVEWSGFLQEWEVFTDHKDPCQRQRLFHHPSRQACLDWERQNWEVLCPQS